MNTELNLNEYLELDFDKQEIKEDIEIKMIKVDEKIKNRQEEQKAIINAHLEMNAKQKKTT